MMTIALLVSALSGVSIAPAIHPLPTPIIVWSPPIVARIEPMAETGYGAVRTKSATHNYVSVPDDAGLDLSGDFTLEQIVRVSAPLALDQVVALVNKSKRGGAPFFFYSSNYEVRIVGNGDGTARLQGGSIAADAAQYVGASVTLTVGRYYSTAVTLSGSTLSVYAAARAYGTLPRDSAYTLVATASLSASGGTTSTALLFGGDVDGAAAGFDITEIRVSSSALDLATLNARLAYRLTAAQAAACVAYWPCDDGLDGFPGRVADHSGYGHDGTFTGIPLYTDGPTDLAYP